MSEILPMDYLEWMLDQIESRVEPRKRTEFLEALAKSMGMSAKHIYVYLRGESLFNSEQIDKAAAFFGVESPSRSKTRKAAAQKEPVAIYSELPRFTGDGYDYGGGAVVTIGDKSILLGEGSDARILARELVRRWNATRAALTEETGGGE